METMYKEKIMNIKEATQKAIELNKYIITPEFEGAVKIKPTNGSGNCIAMYADGSHPSKHGWQPRANDPTREDWLVVD